MRKSSSLVVLSVVFIMISAMYVWAAPPTTTTSSLSGTYNIVGTTVCVRTAYGPANGNLGPQGFSADGSYVLLTPAATRTRHHRGKLTMNKDGTGTYHVKQMQVDHLQVNVGNQPINEWEGDCGASTFTQADGTLVLLFHTCIGTNISGAGSPGYSGSNNNYWTVLPSSSGDTLLLSQTDPYIQYSWNRNPNEQASYADRICIGSSTGIRLR